MKLNLAAVVVALLALFSAGSAARFFGRGYRGYYGYPNNYYYGNNGYYGDGYGSGYGSGYGNYYSGYRGGYRGLGGFGRRG